MMFTFCFTINIGLAFTISSQSFDLELRFSRNIFGLTGIMLVCVARDDIVKSQQFSLCIFCCFSLRAQSEVSQPNLPLF